MHYRKGTIYVHHETSASFHQALELKCVLCVRLWVALEVSHESELPAVGPTTYTVGPTFINFESTRDRVAGKNTGERAALEFIVAQNNRCLKQHAACHRNKSANEFFPTRAIDVGSVTDPLVRLCERKDITPGMRYASLSHCWGKTLLITLSKATASVLKRGIAVVTLPKTFQDAIAVTRELQLQYLWIDSLCIFQDDPDDWRRESSRMRDVYRNAAFCIAATAAKNGDVGLFFDRDPQLFGPIPMDLTWPEYEHKDSLRQCNFPLLDDPWHIDAAPLNKRAWVAQERYLSPRILHFTRKLLYWECGETLASEFHQDSHVRGQSSSRYLKGLVDRHRYHKPASPRSVQNQLNITEPLETGEGKQAQVFNAWIYFRRFYTSCFLTRDSDILVALHGIAEDVGEVMNDDLVVGLWRRRLSQDLCWRINPDSSKPFRPASWRGPSWSWVSSAQPINGRYFHQWPSDTFCKIGDIQVDTNSLGDMILAVLILHCRLIPASKALGHKLDRDEPAPPGEEEKQYYMIILHGDSFDGLLGPDSLYVSSVFVQSHHRISHFRSLSPSTPKPTLSSAFETLH
ncbi:heterokaryon incompatibility protein-domain-containing protein [Clohesyomyces aquaticus]|uniref:Heterokaryon incompatibility protein-domain-containing protein n=1 Tax=Clohesyomyces aquaticus TaxID=1231657 RepID=A0A1Y1ZM63_9PLEO|nr:heterokaryon incompatibility protein-domain-containing protein [Clohesyomyces aquaticus]